NHHSYVEVCRKYERERKPHGNQREEGRACLTRNAEAKPSIQRECPSEQHKSQKSELLADRTRHEVVELEWEKAELLQPLTETDAEGSARPDSDQRLVQLIAVSVTDGGWVEEGS